MLWKRPSTGKPGITKGSPVRNHENVLKYRGFTAFPAACSVFSPDFPLAFPPDFPLDLQGRPLGSVVFGGALPPLGLRVVAMRVRMVVVSSLGGL